MLTYWIDHVPKFKLHASSLELEQILVRDDQCLMTGFLINSVGPTIQIIFSLPVIEKTK